MPENKLFETLSNLQICKLLQCVREGDKEQIEKLILNGVPNLINVNEPTDGETALTIAAAANNDDMIKYLLDLGADPDVSDFKRRTPVMRAAEYGNVQCLQKLAEAKANMKLKDIDGKGIIFYCISPSTRHHKCLEIVLSNEPDVNNKSKEGVPVLVFACETAKENEDLCMMLIEAAADVNCRVDKTNRTAVMAASGSGSAKVVKALLSRGAEVNALITRSKIHAAHLAARCGALDVLQVLSAYGARFDQLDDKNNTPIHYGALAGHGPCCRFLAQRGCNPKPKNSDGMVARLLAKENGHKEAMKDCRKGEKMYGKTGKNNEPWRLVFYDSVCWKKDELMDLFSKSDTETPGKVTKEDFMEILQTSGVALPTPEQLKLVVQAYTVENLISYADFIVGKKYVNKQYLMSAFEGKKKKKKKGGKGKKSKIPMPICTREDLERTEDGGPPNPLVEQHIHFTDISRFDRDKPPLHLIEDDSAWYMQPPEKTYVNLHDAAKHGDLDTVEKALAMHKSVDALDKYFKTPLMVACIHGNIVAAEFFLKNGANVNAKDNFKWTPLHFACHAGLKDIVELLLNNGALMESVALNGGTPLMRAIESSRPDIVQMLIERGAKVQIENRNGMTPLDVAASWGDYRVFDVVKTKLDSLPPIDEKKKKKAGKRSPSPKRPKSSTELPKIQSQGQLAGSQLTDRSPSHQRKGSVLRAASTLAGGLEEKEDITFTPVHVWTCQPSTQALLQNRAVRRDRFTWEVDFDDFKMPFNKNVAIKVEAAGGFDD